MNTAEVIAALDLPASARVDRRVPKTLLVEHAAPTAADKRWINDGIEGVHWLAALKPTTIGVPAYRDEVREYLEIAVVEVVLREGAKAGRLAELIHRAVPYPVFLIATEGDRLTSSLAHKRWSQRESGATVLDGELVAAPLETGEQRGFTAEVRTALALNHRPRANLFALYQGWIDAMLTVVAARMTGAFRVASSPQEAAERRSALRDLAQLDAEIARLRAAAAKEKQVPRQVELNLELKRIEAARAAAMARLG